MQLICPSLCVHSQRKKITIFIPIFKCCVFSLLTLSLHHFYKRRSFDCCLLPLETQIYTLVSGLCCLLCFDSLLRYYSNFSSGPDEHLVFHVLEPLAYLHKSYNFKRGVTLCPLITTFIL